MSTADQVTKAFQAWLRRPSPAARRSQDIPIPQGVPILSVPPTYWECQFCPYEDVTYVAEPHTRFHPCRGKGGLSWPMRPRDSKWDIRPVEREDFVGAEIVQTDANGRPIMAAITERPDGQDVAVFAPTAQGRVRDYQ